MAKKVRVLLGVTGSIAAYKACDIVRRLRERGAEVTVAATRSARLFITPLSLQVLSGRPVLTDLHDPDQWDSAHLSLADWADAAVVGPATADVIARLAHGRADDILTAAVLAIREPVAVCPAMEENMWTHPATRANVERLRSIGYEVWGPAEGPLASGKNGWGRMIEPSVIAEKALRLALKRPSRKPSRKRGG